MDSLVLQLRDTGTDRWARADAVRLVRALSAGSGLATPLLRARVSTAPTEFRGVVQDVEPALRSLPLETAPMALLVPFRMLPSPSWSPICVLTKETKSGAQTQETPTLGATTPTSISWTTT